MSQIIAAATAFTGTYAAAIALGADGTPSSLSACADAMSSHYKPNLTAFTGGNIHQLATPSDASTGTLSHLQKLVKSGVGCDIVLARQKVNEVSATSAIVFATWELKSKKKGVPSWRWRNVYGFRMIEGSEGKWEWIISDNEITELLKRVPDYFRL